MGHKRRGHKAARSDVPPTSKERMPYLLSTYRSDDRVVIQCESIEKAEAALSRVMAWLQSQVETVVVDGRSWQMSQVSVAMEAYAEKLRVHAVKTAAEVPQTSEILAPETPAQHPAAQSLRELADAQDAQDPDDLIAFTPTALRRLADSIEQRRGCAFPERPKSDQRSVTLNGYQLKAALALIAPDSDPDQLESEVSIQWGDAGHSGGGYYACMSEYPEEGSVLLDHKAPDSEAAALLPLACPSCSAYVRAHGGPSAVYHGDGPCPPYFTEKTP